MRRTIILILILFTAGAIQAQVISIENSRDSARNIRSLSHGVPQFQFNNCDTVLTIHAQALLDAFGQRHKAILSDGQKYVIELDLETSNIKQCDRDLAISRAMVMVGYLEKNYGMGKVNFIARVHETTKTLCYGFIDPEKLLKETGVQSGDTKKEK